MKTKVPVLLVAVLDPKEYDFVNKETGERINGKTLRASIIEPISREAMTLKINEDEFEALSKLPMMTPIELVYVFGKALSVVNGRAVEEFKARRDGFEIPESVKSAKSA